MNDIELSQHVTYCPINKWGTIVRENPLSEAKSTNDVLLDEGSRKLCIYLSEGEDLHPF